MKTILFLAMALVVTSQAYAAKACDELKTEIAAKLDAKGVKSYSLEIAEKDKATGTVVGTCEGGTKVITYTKK